MAGYIQDKGKGLYVPDTSSLLTDVQDEFKTVYGQNINLNSETLQGILINGEVTARANVVKNNAEVSNQLNPNIASDVFLDSICALMDIERVKDSSTVFTGVRITGNPGTTIPAKSRCRTQNDDVVRILSDVVIPAGGSTTAVFYSDSYGSVSMGPVGTNWTIVDGVIGWGNATPLSTTTVVPGTTRQLDPALRNHRRNVLALQGRQSVRAIKARLALIPQIVKSSSVRENNTKTFPKTIDGVVFSEPNSVWVCVDVGVYGTDPDVSVINAVAEQLMEAKSCGSDWDTGTGNGLAQSTVFVEPASGQSYTVKFTTGQIINGRCRVQVKQLNTVDNPQAACLDAIMAWSTGQNTNEPGLVLGADLSAFEIAGAIGVGVPGMYVANVVVWDDSDPTERTVVTAQLWQRVNLPRGNITVEVIA